MFILARTQPYSRGVSLNARCASLLWAANLDRASADAIIDLLAGLAGPERGLVVASHDAHLIERADTVLRLE